MDKIFVIAGTFGEFSLFRRSLMSAMITEGIPVRMSSIIYLNNPEVIRGMRNVWGYKVGRWKVRPDIDTIIQSVKLTHSDIDEDFIQVKL